mgnify:CR=1 FL=1
MQVLILFQVSDFPFLLLFLFRILALQFGICLELKICDLEFKDSDLVLSMVLSGPQAAIPILAITPINRLSFDSQLAIYLHFLFVVKYV